MPIFTLTEENFEETVTKHDIVVIDFWAEWCGPCKDFEKIYEAVAEQNPDVVFGKINVDEESKLKNDFQVRSIPTLLILRQKIGVFYQSGIMPASALQDLIMQAKVLDMQKVLNDLESYPGDK